MLPYQHKRAISIIKETISDIGLDLRGIEVLTEVGSNNYIYTPIIAALAGAKKVNAWTRDSSYGLGKDIKAECLNLANHVGIMTINIEVNDRPSNQVKSADIVTNSGFLRPIDKEFINQIKPTSVIPLMYEAWEYRKEDLDADYCIRKGIKIAGTWENHPSLKVFEKIGALSLKLALQAGFEVAQNKILIWSDDEFGREAYKAFQLLNPEWIILTTDAGKFIEVLPDLDFIFICDYDEPRPYFGSLNSIFDLEAVLNLNDKLGVIHLYGDINCQVLQSKGLLCYPTGNGKAKIMSETLGYLGLLPIIKLQAAGLKVGEALFKNQRSDFQQELQPL